MTMIGVDILIAVWVLIFTPIALLPLIRRESDRSTTDEAVHEQQAAEHTLDMRDIAAMSSNRDLSHAA